MQTQILGQEFIKPDECTENEAGIRRCHVKLGLFDLGKLTPDFDYIISTREKYQIYADVIN